MIEKQIKLSLRRLSSKFSEHSVGLNSFNADDNRKYLKKKTSKRKSNKAF